MRTVHLDTVNCPPFDWTPSIAHRSFGHCSIGHRQLPTVRLDTVRLDTVNCPPFVWTLFDWTPSIAHRSFGHSSIGHRLIWKVHAQTAPPTPAPPPYKPMWNTSGVQTNGGQLTVSNRTQGKTMECSNK
ncbi:c2 domain-containing protein [Lasius niger]|uniref:C2 domain-containing protein n=1 Tax=Lasius niger TaxID=67767 RepID=A0A0J7KKD5_LASNI|nr:c2 domain-containing protein [Lasius niger]